jgi:hypothetical protein
LIPEGLWYVVFNEGVIGSQFGDARSYPTGDPRRAPDTYVLVYGTRMTVRGQPISSPLRLPTQYDTYHPEWDTPNLVWMEMTASDLQQGLGMEILDDDTNDPEGPASGGPASEVICGYGLVSMPTQKFVDGYFPAGCPPGDRSYAKLTITLVPE